jgi:hypothetical protein
VLDEDVSMQVDVSVLDEDVSTYVVVSGGGE